MAQRGELTPEQQRNRAIVFVALRVLAGLLAAATAVQFWQGLDDGYFRFGLGDSRGSSRDYVVLDTPLGRAIGSFALEAIAVTFGVLAIRPKAALNPRFLIPSVAAMLIGSILIGVLYG